MSVKTYWAKIDDEDYHGPVVKSHEHENAIKKVNEKLEKAVKALQEVKQLIQRPQKDAIQKAKDVIEKILGQK